MRSSILFMHVYVCKWKYVWICKRNLATNFYNVYFNINLPSASRSSKWVLDLTVTLYAFRLSLMCAITALRNLLDFITLTTPVKEHRRYITSHWWYTLSESVLLRKMYHHSRETTYFMSTTPTTVYVTCNYRGERNNGWKFWLAVECLSPTAICNHTTLTFNKSPSLDFHSPFPAHSRADFLQ